MSSSSIALGTTVRRRSRSRAATGAIAGQPRLAVVPWPPPCVSSMPASAPCSCASLGHEREVARVVVVPDALRRRPASSRSPGVTSAYSVQTAAQPPSAFMARKQRLGAGLLGPEAGAVRHLVEAVPQRLRADLDAARRGRHGGDRAACAWIGSLLWRRRSKRVRAESLVAESLEAAGRRGRVRRARDPRAGDLGRPAHEPDARDRAAHRALGRLRRGRLRADERTAGAAPALDRARRAHLARGAHGGRERPRPRRRDREPDPAGADRRRPRVPARAPRPEGVVRAGRQVGGARRAARRRSRELLGRGLAPRAHAAERPGLPRDPGRPARRGDGRPRRRARHGAPSCRRCPPTRTSGRGCPPARRRRARRWSGRAAACCAPAPGTSCARWPSGSARPW